MINLNKSIKYSALITLTFIIVNVILFTSFSNKLPAYDAFFYELVAKSILKGETTIVDEGKITDIGLEVTPGYSTFIASVYFTIGNDPLNVYIVQSLLSLVSLFIVYALVAKKTNESYGLITTISLAIYIPIWRYNYTLLMEILTIAILCLAIYSLFLYTSKNNKWYLFLYGFLFSVLTFVNNRFVVLFVISVVFLIFRSLKNTTQLKQLLLNFLIFTLLLIPWHIRQFLVYDSFVVFTPTWTNLLNQSFGIPQRVDVITDLDRKPDTIKTYNEYIAEIKKTRADETYKKFTLQKYDQLVKNHPNNSKNPNFYKYFSRTIAFWEVANFDFEWVPGIDYRIKLPSSPSQLIMNLIVLLPVFLFFVFGAYYTFKNNDIFLQLLTFFVLGHWFLHISIHYIDRYRLTILPIVFIIAGYGIFNVSMRFKKSLRFV